MFDIGWTEVLVISVVVLFVVGPRDIPKVLRTIGQWAGKIRGLAKEFRESVDDAVRESELDEVRKTVEAARSGFRNEIRATVDPGGDLTRSLRDVGAPSAKEPQSSTAGEKSSEEQDEGKPTAETPDSPPPPPRPPSVPAGAPKVQQAKVAEAVARPHESVTPRPVGLRHLGASKSDPASDEG